MNELGEEYDSVFHMGSDQYEVYSIVMNTLNRQKALMTTMWLFFITGSAGIGKSFLLSGLAGSLEGHGIKFLKMAPIGIAAINIGGQSIHSALAITLIDGGMSFVTSMHQSTDNLEELQAVKVLLIDELWMVSSKLLNFVSQQFQRLHNDSAQPFGGLIVVAFGDLLQLLPVSELAVYQSYL